MPPAVARGVTTIGFFRPMALMLPTISSEDAAVPLSRVDHLDLIDRDHPDLGWLPVLGHAALLRRARCAIPYR